MRKSQPVVVIVIIAMAIILAAGSFFALMYINRRPDTPADTFVTTVEGVDVTLSMDPASGVRIVGLEQLPSGLDVQGAAPVMPAAEQPVQENTEIQMTVEPPTATPEPVPTAAPDPVIFEPYTVYDNDSLYSIADRVDTSIVLMAQYGISQYELVPGTVIQLPVGNPAYCPQADRQPYAVGEAETAFSIGKRFGITADQLREINGLDANYTVYGGSILCVPR